MVLVTSNYKNFEFHLFEKSTRQETSKGGANIRKGPFTFGQSNLLPN
jgi:hypothetical protein